MKKILILVVCVAMLAVAIGCQAQPAAPAAPAEAPAAAPAEAPAEMPAQEAVPAAPAEEAAPASGMAKTGLSITTGVAKSASATAEGDGKAQADSIIVAVTVDEMGKITNCVIDSAQSAINFSAEGKLTTDMAAEFKTKQELGADYGMIKASGIGKEWFEQINALADYVKGKTVAEVQGVALTEEGKAADADLAASATISLGSYIDAIVQAAENAMEQGAAADNKLGIGVITSASKSKDATAEEAGLAQAYSTYAIATVDDMGVITSCIIDASQANVNFDAMGAITSDLAAAVPTKNELGADYGMIKASTIGKEWNEQAAAFAAYCVGKTANEVMGIAMNEEGRAGDADLMASVSVHIGEFMDVVYKAAMNAK